MQRHISVPGLGPVLISKISNARKLKIRIHPEKGILVTIPKRSSFREGEKFVLKNIEWINDKIGLIHTQNNENKFNQDSIFITRNSKLHFDVDTRVDIKAIIKGFDLTILYNPLKIDFQAQIVQDFIKENILRLLKKEAKLVISKRYSYLASRHQLHASKLSFGKAATRWGTCNTKNEIRLSCRLLLLPDHLIDYVVLNELSHLVHKNNGDEFHQLLNSLTNGHSAALNKELRTHSIHIKPGNYKFE
ncbi:MAG: hypothetical protein C0596_11920 [Marinilabiliales bacterium]|nr:MAG: hypothetical protein C0596_11920 [Marinilabiliales bacterium]